MHQPTQPRFRPSDLLPWADPHIRSLVQQLQEEVRGEDLMQRESMVEDLESEIEANQLRDGDARLAADLWSDDPLAHWSPNSRRF